MYNTSFTFSIPFLVDVSLLLFDAPFPQRMQHFEALNCEVLHLRDCSVRSGNLHLVGSSLILSPEKNLKNEIRRHKICRYIDLQGKMVS